MWESNRPSPPSSPWAARRAASRAARSSRRAAMRRAGNEPTGRFDQPALGELPARDERQRERIGGRTGADGKHQRKPHTRAHGRAFERTRGAECHGRRQRDEGGRVALVQPHAGRGDLARDVLDRAAAPRRDRRARRLPRAATGTPGRPSGWRAMAVRTPDRSWSGWSPSSGTPRDSSVASARVAMH